MNEPVDHPVWSDERVESLLREFFRNEMPADLQESTESPRPRSVAAPRPRIRATSPRRGRLFGVVTAATAVVATLVALMVQMPTDERSAGGGPEAESRGAVAGDSDSASPVLDRLARPGAREPVELRARGGIENVDTTAPGLDIEYPEWEADIRYYGVDENQKRKPDDRN